MDNQKGYSFREKIALVMLLTVSIISLGIFMRYRTLAFPEHNIQLKITTSEASLKAEELIKSLGFNVDTYKRATIFTVDNDAKTYLEREVGVKETAALAQDEISLWNFATRFYRPMEKEEFVASFLPNGRFSEFRHEIEEEAPGPSLSNEEARMRAEEFLERFTHIKVEEWKLVSDETIERPGRLDHFFVWEKKDFFMKEATERIQVGIWGEEVGDYKEFLHIPEIWQRSYQEEVSHNALAQNITEVITFLVFGIGIIVTFILYIRSRSIRFRFAWWVAGIAIFVSILTQLNSLPLLLYEYDTTVSWTAFVGGFIMTAIVGSFFQGVIVFFIVAAGEALWRNMFPTGFALEVVGRQGLKTKFLNKSLLVGTFVGIILLAYEIGYYLLGKQIGFWAPAEVNYSDLFTTPLPWMYPLFIGFMAAVVEEGIFRLFGIPFLKKYLKSTWLAVIITSLVWAFLHSSYPQSPWFVRGIEISLVGIVFGILFLRYGIMASITAHYTFNALQTAIFFYGSYDFSIGLSSTIVSLAPFLIAVGSMVSVGKKGFMPFSHHATNAFINENPPAHSLKEQSSTDGEASMFYRPLSKWTVGILFLLALIGFAIGWRESPWVELKSIPPSLTRSEAIENAHELLERQGIKNIDEYYSVASFATNVFYSEYILEEGDFVTLKHIYADKIPPDLWRVSFFKPLQKEEYIVFYLPNGTLYDIQYIINEKASGASLTSEEALTLAKHYLSMNAAYDFSGYEMIDKRSEKREGRIDHAFTFEESLSEDSNITLRASVEVLGDKVTNLMQATKVPEAWFRKNDTMTTAGFIVVSILGVIIIGVIILGAVTFFRFVRDGKIFFREAFIIAGIGTALSAGEQLNSAPTFYRFYDTSLSLWNYTLQSLVVNIFVLVGTFLLIALSVGMFLALWRTYGGREEMDNAKSSRYSWRDALIAGYTLPLIGWGASTFMTSFLIRNDWLLMNFDYDTTILGVDSFLPFVRVAAYGIWTFTIAVLLASAVFILRRYLGGWERVTWFAVVFSLLAAILWSKTIEEFGVALFYNMFLVGGAIVAVRFIMKNNLSAYIVAIYTSLLLESGWRLFETDQTFLMANGAVVLLFALFPLLIYWWYSKRLASSL